jgi:hypothetical protein
VTFLKRYIALLLIGILVFQAEGVLFIHQLEQCIIQYRVKRGMEHTTQKAETMILSLKYYNSSMRHGSEITYEGQLYDIKSLSIDGEVVTLKVFHDIAEETILKKIKDFFNSHGRTSGKVPKYVQKLLVAKYVTPTQDIFLEPVYRSATYFSFLLLKFEAAALDIPSPPPK